MKQNAFANPQVAAVFDAYPAEMRGKLMTLRQLIFDTASQTDGVGELEETLKWGSPSYLTATSKSGTTLRIERRKSRADEYAICVHCQTNLLDQFQERHGNALTYDGNRGVVLDAHDDIPVAELSYFIYLALTYHLRKKRGRRLPKKR